MHMCIRRHIAHHQAAKIEKGEESHTKKNV